MSAVQPLLGAASASVGIGVTLEARALSHRYGRRPGLSALSFRVDAPGFLAVTGPNGSGKSTLARILAGLLRPSAGACVLRVGDRSVPPAERRRFLGYAGPALAFYDELTALENLELAAEAAGAPRPRARETLERVALGARAQDRVGALSSGMVQRLRLGFALLHQPRILILDEPGSHLDEEGRALLSGLLSEAGRRGLVVIATNDEREWSLAEQRIELQGPAPSFATPRFDETRGPLDPGDMASPRPFSLEPSSPASPAAPAPSLSRASPRSSSTLDAPSLSPRPPSFGNGTIAVLRKECRSEWRTRYGLNAALLFAVTSLTAVSFAVGRLPDRTDVLSALLWVVLLFGALASLAHAFVREVESRTMTFLRLVASPLEIASGKFLFNLLFLLVIEIVTVPLFLVLMGAPSPRWGVFLGLLGLGSLALASSCTLIGALVSQTRGRGALFAGVSLPLLMPVLAAAVSGTRAQWAGSASAAEIRLLAAYAAAMMAVGALLVDVLWED